MKRFLVLCFTLISVLSHGVGHSQTKANTGDNPNASPPVAQSQNAANDTPERKHNQLHVENDDVLGDKGTPVVTRLSELAKKTNFTLAVSIVATLIAFASWRANKEAVKVTREIGEKQSCAYIKMKDVRVGHNHSHAICEITIENVGNSPCVEGAIKAKIKSENTLVPTSIETDEVRDFYSSDETQKFGIIQTGHPHTVSFSWFGGHYDTPNNWFNLFLSDIGADSRVVFEVRWKDVFGKWHTSNFDAHKHHGKAINWKDMRIWSESLKINPQQEYKREK